MLGAQVECGRPPQDAEQRVRHDAAEVGQHTHLFDVLIVLRVAYPGGDAQVFGQVEGQFGKHGPGVRILIERVEAVAVQGRGRQVQCGQRRIRKNRRLHGRQVAEYDEGVPVIAQFLGLVIGACEVLQESSRGRGQQQFLAELLVLLGASTVEELQRAVIGIQLIGEFVLGVGGDGAQGVFTETPVDGHLVDVGFGVVKQPGLGEAAVVEGIEVGPGEP